MTISTPKSCTFLSYQSSNFHNKDINLSMQYKPKNRYILYLLAELWNSIDIKHNKEYE